MQKTTIKYFDYDAFYFPGSDLSFNRLTGEVPADASAPKYTYVQSC